MYKTFVSYSSKDANFVTLLVSLLKYHYIDTWASSHDLAPGMKYPDEIQTAIEQSEVLIVVVSENATIGKWVTKEIATFETLNKDGIVVPIMLDSTNLDLIAPGLSKYQKIDFSKSMLIGCERLFSVFGKEFLQYNDRRNNSTRRNSSDRRAADRRKSNLIQRLRIGFWKAYSDFTGKDKFEELSVTVKEQFKVADSLRYEVEKYRLYDDSNKLCPTADVLEATIYKVWSEMKSRESIKAVYVLESIAEDICDNYRIVVIRDRDSSRREEEGSRRNSK